MARTTDQPGTATQPTTATAKAETDARDPRDEQNKRDEQNQYGENNNDRREYGLSSVRDEQDQRGDNRDSHSDRSDRIDRENRENRDERTFGEKRGFGENRDRREQFSERGEQDSPWATSGAEMYAPVLDAWKQVFQAWSELAETMVKTQQQSFASMMGATQATAKNLTNGGHRNRERALSGARSDSRAADQIDHDRR